MLWECDLKAEGSQESYVIAAVWMGSVLCVSRLCMDIVWRHSSNPTGAPVQTLLQAHPHYLGVRHDRPDKMAIV